MEDELKLYRSRIKQVQVFLSVILLTTASIFIAIRGSEEGEIFLFISGVVGALVFGICLTVATGQFFEERANVTIDRYGIHVSDWKCGLIPWEDIAEIWVEILRVKYYTTKYITFQLKEPSKYIRLLPLVAKVAVRMSTLVGRGDKFSLAVESYGMGVDDVWDHIRMLKTSHRIPVSLRDGC